jgi:uncharacterized membrane protein YvbJ
MREKILQKIKEKQKTLEKVRSHNKAQHPFTEDSKTYDRDFVPKANTRQKIISLSLWEIVVFIIVIIIFVFIYFRFG